MTEILSALVSHTWLFIRVKKISTTQSLATIHPLQTNGRTNRRQLSPIAWP